jgi:hypothetical protein
MRTPFSTEGNATDLLKKTELVPYDFKEKKYHN